MEHITNYLDYYIALSKSPEFAVLLRGKWGSGKSFFVKKFMEVHEPKNFVYITLNGVNSPKEINDQIFEQLHPVLSSKGMKIAGKIFTGIVKAALKIDLKDKSEIDVNPDFSKIELPEYLKNTDKKVLVFDDLERCTMSIPSVLGYINQFVEVNGNKVIIIANEEEIIEREDKREKKLAHDSELVNTPPTDVVKYIRVKEKLVGKSFELLPDTDTALNTFLEGVQDANANRLLTGYKDLINQLYQTAGYQNLRHLKQAILDFERFYLLLPPMALTKQDLVNDLIAWFFVFSFELKKGNIIEEELTKMFPQMAVIAGEDNDSLFSKLRTKYSLNSFPLNVHCWVTLFKTGTVATSVLEEVLKHSRYFFTENTPPYIRLWSFLEIEDEVFEADYRQVLNDFESNRIPDALLLLHITAMFLYYSHIGLIPITKTEIIELAKINVKALKDRKCLVFDYNPHMPLHGYGSLGFLGINLPEFQAFIHFVKTEADALELSGYPNEAAELLDEMKKSTVAFRQKVTLNNISESKYFNIPIFSHIPPETFAAAFLSIPNAEKRNVGYALRQRYMHPEFSKDLQEELPWLKMVIELLEEEKKARASLPSGLVIGRVISEFLSPSVQVFESVVTIPAD